MAKKRTRNTNKNEATDESSSIKNNVSVSGITIDWLIVFLGALLAVSFGVLLEQLRSLWLETQSDSIGDVTEREGRGVARVRLQNLSENDSSDVLVAEVKAFVDRNEPFVCRSCLPPASLGGWWDDDTNLVNVIGEETHLLVRVAERSDGKLNGQGIEGLPTQFRRTTAPGLQSGEGSAYHERNMTANDFFASYNPQGKNGSRELRNEHWYLAQIDIVSMLPSLLPYIHSSAPPRAEILDAVGPTPSASRRPFSMYLGAGLRTIQTHYDSFENVVCVVSGGSKTFDLYDPTTSSKLLYIDRSKHGNGSPVPPQTRDHSGYPLAKYALPSSVTLRIGDCLYLPVYWYHSVTSSAERTISINWWREPNPKKMGILENLFCGKANYGASAKCDLKNSNT